MRDANAEILREALCKIRINLRSGLEVQPLSVSQNKYLHLHCPFQTIHWIDPARIIYRLDGLSWRGKNELIMHGGTEFLGSFADHSTSVFIRELLNESKRLEETKLYKEMGLEEVELRVVHIGGQRVRIPLNSRENMMIYFHKCQALVDSIRAKGVESLDTAPGSARGVIKDKNIGIAVTSDGRLAHFRRGHHRLAIAQALGLKRIPVEINFVSAKYLADRFPPWRLWSNSAMVRGVNRLLTDAVEGTAKRFTRS